MKNLTCSVYTFERLRTANYLYVDKTAYLWNLIRNDGTMYFLSRPRRFGKSLTVSTLKAIFQGKKELFQGLAIYNKPCDWEKYPVIHLDFSDYESVNSTSEKAQTYLIENLRQIARNNGIVFENENVSPGMYFAELILKMSEEKNVVILIDEYDKLITENLGKRCVAEIRDILSGFYSVLKKYENRIRFLLMTGVTKFSQVSLFSKLNNLTDITMNADYATMLGYTQDELDTYFAEWIAETEKRQDLPHDKFLARIKEWYDGYRFEETAENVYNPVSLANFFTNHGKFNNYWFSTGTLTFLMDLIKQKQMDLRKVLSEPATMFSFGSFEIDSVPPVMLLLQTGYLTIKTSVVKHGKTRYMLDFPNREVSESFNVYLLNAYSKTSQDGGSNFCELLTDAIEEGDLKNFQKAVEVFFAGIPYDVHHKSEANFQNIFYAIFRLLGFNVYAESKTSDGRIDAFIETDKYIYLFEFKLNNDNSALAQIKEKEYFKPFLLSSKKITLVGANFSTETGRISNWQDEAVTR